jgi:hypothetical protein
MKDHDKSDPLELDWHSTFPIQRIELLLLQVKAGG